MKLIVAVAAMLGIGASGVASAADLAVKAPRAVAPLYNWTGCYLGGNVGGAWSKMDTTRVQIDNPLTTVQDNFGSGKDSGFIGGGQVGCDFQTTNLVFGIEGQFDFGSVKDTHNIPALAGFTESNNMKELYLATGRIGYLWTPQLLGYVKVGAAFMVNKNTIFAPGGAVNSSAEFRDPGIVAGLGFEYMFTPNWSVFAEANYIWTEDDSAAHDFVSPAGTPVQVINDRQRIIAAMVGVNYKFHWDGPVVAKY